MARVIDPHYHRKFGLLLHNGGKAEYVWNAGNPLGCLIRPLLIPKSFHQSQASWPSESISITSHPKEFLKHLLRR